MKFKIGDQVRIKKEEFGEGLTGKIIGEDGSREYFQIHPDKKHDLHVIDNGGIQKVRDWYYWHKSHLEKVKLCK